MSPIWCIVQALTSEKDQIKGTWFSYWGPHPYIIPLSIIQGQYPTSCYPTESFPVTFRNFIVVWCSYGYAKGRLWQKLDIIIFWYQIRCSSVSEVLKRNVSAMWSNRHMVTSIKIKSISLILLIWWMRRTLNTFLTTPQSEKIALQSFLFKFRTEWYGIWNNILLWRLMLTLWKNGIFSSHLIRLRD